MQVQHAQSTNYQLLDFGSGRKLEQFGPVVLDRLCPAAEGVALRSSGLWRDSNLKLPEQANSMPRMREPWLVSFPLDAESAAGSSLRFQLKVTPFGHVGVFPEQLQHWRWLSQLGSKWQSAAEAQGEQARKLKALNLFAYTGGSTMALAFGGAEVVHVDASAPAVAWARSNAQLNELEQHPIRWIVEDARKFVQREIRRGSSYDIVVLDPPSYGHGPTGKPWDLATEWTELLAGCMELLKHSLRPRLLWTGHSDVPSALSIIEFANSFRDWQSTTDRNQLCDLSGRQLDAGYYVLLE
jgi:23S rRNA (cytosine1962-C5)-methyltransferase